MHGSNHAADQCLYFCICRKQVFLWRSSCIVAVLKMTEKARRESRGNCQEVEGKQRQTAEREPEVSGRKG